MLQEVNMSLIGVRELRQQTSEVIRRVREDGAEYVVTYQGRPVAIILPLDAERAEEEMVRAGRKAVLGNWERYEQLADEIRAAWPAGIDTQDLIDAIRR
jgi:prevent-host-death family protein